jgi:hypothetical protein
MEMLESAVFWGCVLLFLSFVVALAPERRPRATVRRSDGGPVKTR